MKSFIKNLFASDTAQMFWGGYALFCGPVVLAFLITTAPFSLLVGCSVVYAVLFPFGNAILKAGVR